MKKIGALVVGCLLALSFTTAHGVDIPDEQVVPGSLSTGSDSQQSYGVFFEESVDTLRMPSLLYGFNITNNQMNAVDFCSGLDDPACSKAERFKYYALFPPCLAQADVDCIESVYAIPAGSPGKIQGKFVRQMPANVAKPFKGSLKDGLPQGGNAGIWTIPGVKHKGGGEDYAVIVSRVGELSPGSNSKPDIGEFRAVILPETMVSNPGYKANIAVIDDHGTPGQKHVAITHTGSVNFEPCAIVEDGACALRQGFPDKVKFGLAIRFSQAVPGWLHGRIGDPVIDYQVKPYGTFIEMQGNALNVPIVGGWVKPDSSNQATLDQIKSTAFLPNLGNGAFPGAVGTQSMNSLVLWSKLFDEKAVANPSQWIFYNLQSYQMEGSDNCIKNSQTLAGFVTTNSTTYAAGPPVFNKESQSLDYKVASAHFLKDGSVFKGEYNLYIDSKVARCIYKFSSAPISASISIVTATGEQNVAVTTVNESNGWLHLSASGFTFSSPTIRVKLTQEGSSTASTINSSASKKITIVCKKGKAVKKVTSVKPVCPAGYKKS